MKNELFGISEQLDDTISRQAAIDALAEWHDEAITNRLNNLPSAQRWIPCSTEMPPTGKDVLVTLEGGTVTDGERWEPQKGKWFLFGGGVNGLDEDVIAWMPLPAPWKGDTP